MQTPPWLAQARDSWTNRGETRPPFAIEPGPGQESVWDYTRPPTIVADTRAIEIRSQGTLVAAADRSVKVCETSHPPSFYLPPDSLIDGAFVVASGSSHCEWKGQAEYLCLAGNQTPVGWRYPTPYVEFEAYAGWVSFYPDRVECVVNGQVARAQAGGFYGGWITDEIVGPFKGEPGTQGW